MSFKIISALAKSHFAISEEGVHGYFPTAQAILAGTYAGADEPRAEDDFLEDDYIEDSEQREDEFTGRIAVMRVTGVLMHYGGMCSYGTQDYADRINQYAADDSISGLIVLADTPGGQVDGIETLREAVINFKAKKPLITLINDGNLCSGGVWGFGGSTEVYAANTLCYAGSVGVMCTLLDIRKALEMNGIKEVIIRAPQSKDKARTVEDALDGKTAEIEKILSFICERFLTVVETDRAGKINGDEWKTGKVFFAAEAQRIGLIDGIKNYTEVVARMQELIVQNPNNNMSLIRFPKLAALKKADNITAESLDAVNAEIADYGISGVVACLQSDIEALEDSETTINALETKVTDLSGQVSAKDTRITELEGKVTALEAKIAGKPAETPSAPASAGDEIPSTEANADYETSVDREAAEMRKAMGL